VRSINGTDEIFFYTAFSNRQANYPETNINYLF
jgi:hypothetical protein